MTNQFATLLKGDPLRLVKFCWPSIALADYQADILQSVEDNVETFVPAANQIGKDFIAGLTALTYFIRKHPVKVITTSVKEKHLLILWGEIDCLIRTSQYPLLWKDGGLLIYNHFDIRKVVKGQTHKGVYMLGQVSEKGEGISGHHERYSLIVGDEASGLHDDVYKFSQPWAKRRLYIGNTNPSHNFFRKAVEGGDLEMPFEVKSA